MKRAVVLFLMFVVCFACAQTPPAPAKGSEQKGAAPAQGSGQPPAGTPATAPTTAGPGRPPVVVSALTNSAEVKLRLSLDAEPKAGDLDAGLLNNDQYPNQRIIPDVKLLKSTKGEGNQWEVELRIAGLIAFGDSSVPLLHRGKQVETLRFYKAGLMVKAPPDGALIFREDKNLLLVLENPSEFEYKGVGARVRFQGVDVCTVQADQFKGGSKQTGSDDCAVADNWTTFDIPKYAQVTIRAGSNTAWFRDAATDFYRSAKKKGTLTLRFPSDPAGAVFEQNLPLEVQLEPRTSSLTKSLLWVFVWLLVGALVSLLLRVTIPNYRQKKALKDQLLEARTATREISDRVESSLRVLLRVERLALDQMRRQGWVLGPDFSDVASKVDAGLAVLKRKIGLVQRLDAAQSRRDTLLSEPVSPTRFDVIQRNLVAASQGLKSPQLAEQEWVFIQQRLEAADKALGELSQEEKQAFEALLVQRWKDLRDHFGWLPAQGRFDPPSALAGMSQAFPDASLLPKPADPDGANWVKSIGPVRADLQLTALEVIRDFQFLAPVATTGLWKGAMESLGLWLATPTIQNLEAARSLLLQLAEGKSGLDVLAALAANQAEIELDPQLVTSNQKVRAEMRFRDPRLNSATARMAVECEWRFKEARSVLFGAMWGRQSKTLEPTKASGEGGVEEHRQIERGWRIHHYFEEGVDEYTIEARFFHLGEPVTIDGQSGSEPVVYTRVVRLESPANAGKVWREKWIWGPAPQALQLVAALLVPLATLAITTAGEGTSGRWWDLLTLGFGSETIRNILTGREGQGQKSG